MRRLGARELGFRHVIVCGLVLVAACANSPVGRICDLGTGLPEPSEVVVASPSLDCVSRTCLRVPLSNPDPPAGSVYPSGTSGLCTAECSTDDDCDRVAESPCKSGFTCGVAATVGPFCCKKFCVCKDYMLPQPEPKACDASNAANQCCNLPGRAGCNAL